MVGEIRVYVRDPLQFRGLLRKMVTVRVETRTRTGVFKIGASRLWLRVEEIGRLSQAKPVVIIAILTPATNRLEQHQKTVLDEVDE